ncbi:hypothetical protein L3Y34_000436 [Caenorhabditis briggsae]|uniref:Uncharacterized protein n=1 Tax=Caenorhabditis briggsae TaxID=6238 RepID=A0AAE9D9E1_CAEBR|nr:hypothetical protein L3Y34_000436 [Caenorhabditis briggsae]
MPRSSSNSSQRGSSKGNEQQKIQIPENPRVRRHGHDNDTPPATEYLNIQLGRHEYSEDALRSGTEQFLADLFEKSQNLVEFDGRNRLEPSDMQNALEED